MKIEGDLIIKKFDDLNLYVIERAVHSGGYKLIEVGHPQAAGKSWFWDRWVSTAAVEGSAEEMLKIARAILTRTHYSAKRCAVVVSKDRAFFWSPRNSFSMGWDPPCGEPRGEVPLEVADALAEKIELELVGVRLKPSGGRGAN